MRSLDKRPLLLAGVDDQRLVALLLDAVDVDALVEFDDGRGWGRRPSSSSSGEGVVSAILSSGPCRGTSAFWMMVGTSLMSWGQAFFHSGESQLRTS